jgi:hypothetical protein
MNPPTPVPRVRLPTEYYETIGIITADGAVLDDLVNNAIWVLLAMPPERGKVITNPIINTKRRIDLLAEIARPMISDEEMRRQFNGVHAKLGSAQANRSKIVHAQWLFHRKDQTWHIEVFESDEVRPWAEPMPLSRLKSFVSELDEACDALRSFVSRVKLATERPRAAVWPPHIFGVDARAESKKKKK